MAETRYTCSACGHSFVTERSDEDARAEAATVFPDVPMADMAVVCDNCYQRMMRWLKWTEKKEHAS